MVNESGITFGIKPTPALAESCQNLAAAVCGSDWFGPSPSREHPPLCTSALLNFLGRPYFSAMQ